MSRFDPYRQVLESTQMVGVVGRVCGVRGLTVHVADFPAPLGAACRIARGHVGMEARVIGFSGQDTLIMPIAPMAGICRGDSVVLTASHQTVPVGEEMLGRVLDGFGRPLDGRPPVRCEGRREIWSRPLSPMTRPRISRPLATGVRAIDAMLTIGQGQRMSVFSGSGVGKSVLLGMVARGTSADVTVIALVGERGREVRGFVEEDLGQEGLRKSVVIVSTSDEPPLVRVQAAAAATAVAEHFRDRGANVLLLMDSLTRLATAQRQIGLAAGEPPATKAFPPSVFSLLPELLERTGCTEKGTITGFYNVLAEADDLNDPVCDAVRSVTDGHVFLSRQLARRGHWPAIDVLQSVSRVMRDVADDEHRRAAAAVHRLMGLHAEIEEMVNVGAYQSGGSTEHDLAVRMMPEIRRFLQQDLNVSHGMDATKQALGELYDTIRREARRIQASAAATAEPATRGENR